MVAQILLLTLVLGVSPLLQPPRVGLLLRFEHPPDSRFVKQLRREVSRLFQPSGLDFRWEVLDGGRRPGAYEAVVLVEMRGRCSDHRVFEVREEPESRVDLGWTIVNDGEVIPYSVVDCDQIARVTRRTGQFSDRRLLPWLFLRLAARVTTHEILHVLLQTTEHHNTDFRRSPLDSSALLLDARLSHAEVAALRRLGRNPAGTAIAERPQGR